MPSSSANSESKTLKDLNEPSIATSMLSNRQKNKVSSPHHRLSQYSANTAVWLFVRKCDSLGEVEQEDVIALRQASRVLDRAYRLVQDFFSTLHKREGHRLERWLAQVAESDLPELQQFTRGVERDKTVLQAGLTWEDQ